ncbi:MAG TPA: iron chelate uptake ABC transporter family permease subunit [Methanocorpusculum sp.]|nr:iron chelate uptake ABC transporter family permease subunit [Methanocorpusculum sp.]
MLKRPLILIPILIVLLIVFSGLSLCIGISGFELFSYSPEMIQKLILDVRLPRILGALIVGAGLAAAGCAMQGLFRNPMADPYLLGTSSGGSLGAAFSIVVLGGFLQPVLAFIGSLGSTILVYFASKRNGRVAVETLLLTGIAVSLLLSALLSFLIYLSGNSLKQIMFFTMGGLWNVYWDDVLLGLIIIAAAVILFIFSRDMNVLSLGEEEAVHLGINTEKTKRILLLLSALITAIAVSIAGCIGFVGLIIPHIIRLLTGPDHRILLPASMLAGAILLLLADTFSRTLPTEIPVGIITALLGAPFFIYLLRRRTRI